MYGYRIGYNIFNGASIGAGGLATSIISNTFAKWYSPSSNYLDFTIDGETSRYLAAIPGDKTRIAQPTPVLDFTAGGTIKIVIDELDYPVVFTGIDSGGSGIFIPHKYSTDRYILTPPTTFKGGKIKMWNVDDIQDKLGDELVVNGDFSSWTDDNPDGWAVSLEDVNNYITEDVQGFRLVSDGSFIEMNQNILSSGNAYLIGIDILQLTQGSLLILDSTAAVWTKRIEEVKAYSFTTVGGGKLGVRRYSGVTDVIGSNVTAKQIQLTQQDILSTNYNQTGVAEVFLCEEHGTKTDCDSTYDTLLGKKGIYNASLVGATFPDVRTHDSSIYCDANVVGYSEGENLLKFSESFDESAWIKVSGAAIASNQETSPDGTLTADLIDLTSADSFAYANRIPILPNGNYIFSFYAKALSEESGTWNIASIIVGGAWADDVNVAINDNSWTILSLPVIIGGVPTANYFYVGDSRKGQTLARAYIWGAQLTQTSEVQPYHKTEDYILNKGTWIPALNSSQDIDLNPLTYKGKASQGLEVIKQNALLGDGTASLTFANLPTYTTAHAIEDGVEVAITITANSWTPTNGKKYTSVILKDGSENEVAEIVFQSFDSGKTPIDATKTFYCVLKSGATAVLASATIPDIFDDIKGISHNTLYGWAEIDGSDARYPAFKDGSGYAGLTGTEPGFTEHPPINNGKGRNTSEQQDQAVDNYELRQIDKSTKVCTSSGRIYLESNQAYGIWEFDVNVGSFGNQVFEFINDENSIGMGGYGFDILSDGSFRFLRTFETLLFSTVTPYLELNINYRIKITRTENGEFTAYIKGGDFGNNYVLVDTTGGSGINPVTDNTYTTSNYIVAVLNTGDKFGNLTQNYIPKAITDFTDVTGTFDIEGEFLEADGTPKEVDVATIPDNNYIKVNKDDDDNVYSLIIKK